jgi:hypothetical protein
MSDDESVEYDTTREEAIQNLLSGGERVAKGRQRPVESGEDA